MVGGRVAERFGGTPDGFSIGKQKFGSRSAAAIAQSGKWQTRACNTRGVWLTISPRSLVQEGAHLPSQVTSTRMSPCVDFRRRFFELSWSDVLVNCRLLEEEAMALFFSRIAVRERERRFRIPGRDHPKVTGLSSIASLDGQFPAELQKDSGVLQSKTGGTRRNHPSTSADNGIGGSAHKRGRTMRCSPPSSLPSQWTVSRRGDRRAYAQWMQNRRRRWSMTASNEEACSSHA